MRNSTRNSAKLETDGAKAAKSWETKRVRDIAKLPKTHLHLHFTGSMSPATLQELASDQGIRLPSALKQPIPEVEEPPFGGVSKPRDGERGWFKFQRLYDAARSVVTSEAIMRRIVDEAVAADAAEGSMRLEIQVDPTSYAKYVGGITPALEIVLDEALAASQNHGIEVGVIVAASRVRHPLEARTLARLAAKYAGANPGQVVGFGLSNDEHAGETSAFAPAFRLARDAGLAAVPHAGELKGPAHVAQVFTDLHPVRLGHGVRAAEDPALLERLVAEGVALEVCPASNVSLGVFAEMGAVPLRQLTDAGALIALSADDPLLFGARLNDQYQFAREVHGMDDAALANLARGSIKASIGK